MTDWLRPLLLMFYAPGRALAEVRDQAPLGAAALVAWLAQSAYTVYALWPATAGGVLGSGTTWLFAAFVGAALSLLYTATIFVPSAIFVANLFERRGSFRVAVQQEFASVAAAVLYARAAAVIAAFPLHLLARLGGFEREVVTNAEQLTINFGQQQGVPAEAVAEAVAPQNLLNNFALTMLLPFLLVWT
ncbi:MAG TPA: hypothetical protein VGV38_23725, partial [Pyrinomonadaceae bacterium]|nr:hypothetical protein [Pyrinomonadaceae bacterium]